MRIEAPAKVNVFLKIVGTRGGYHEIRSRFVRIDSLFDTLRFERKQKPSPSFELLSSEPLPVTNTVSKAYDLLGEAAPAVKKFFEVHRVLLEKSIPQGAGLGGGSSDAAAFLNLCNEVCELGFSKEFLAKIGEKIGADVPFFVHGHSSANVEGIGERITPFEETPPSLELFTPPIHCDTARVYRTFRENFFDTIDSRAAMEWLHEESVEVMEHTTPLEANDLYRAALLAYPDLAKWQAPYRFFSGSGSTLFHLLSHESPSRLPEGDEPSLRLSDGFSDK
ncbi:4-(cytidine 5'-diphospho)-2-C-methyl-D-erythritol kinase [Hydrogenimonas sp.]